MGILIVRQAKTLASQARPRIQSYGALGRVWGGLHKIRIPEWGS